MRNEFGDRKRDPKAYTTLRGQLCDSKFEVAVLNSLDARDISYIYQPGKFEYASKVKNAFCRTCEAHGYDSDVVQGRFYTPDLELIPSGMLVEIKGYMDAHTRRLLKEFVTSTKRKFGFVFQTDKRLVKTRETRYTDWAKKLTQHVAVGRHIPEEWANG